MSDTAEPTAMQKVFARYRRFREELFPARQELFAHLKDQQDPHILFITCSDSRIAPDLVIGSEPVFELAFEGIQKSPRHRSGIAVRFPRIARCRTDKKPEDADTIETVKALVCQRMRR